MHNSVYLLKFILCLVVITAQAKNTHVALYENILLADYYSYAQNSVANTYYEKVLAYHNTNQAYQSYIRHLYEHKQYKQLIKLSNQRPELFASTHQSYEQNGYMLAHTLALEGHSTLADALFKKLADTFFENYEITYYAVKAYLTSREYQEALEKIEKLFKYDNQAKYHYIFHFLRYKAYAELHNYTQALSSLQKAITLQPQFEQGWLFMAMLEEKMGNLQQAQYGYERFLELTGDRSIEQKLVTLKSKTKEHEQSVLSATKKAYKEKNYILAQELLTQYLANKVPNDDTNLLQLDLYMAQQQYAQAYKLISQQISQKNSELWFKIGHLFYLNVPDEKNKTNFKNFLFGYAHTKNDTTALLYALDIALRAEQSSHFRVQKYSAQNFANKALKLIEDETLASKILFQVAAMYYKHRDYKKLHTILQNPIVAKTTYAPLVNFAAYFYATKGNDLALAEKYMVKLALDNPHISDTQALILYKKRDFAKAYEILNAARKELPTDATLLRHIAKVSAKLNKPQEAIEALERAIVYERSDYKKKRLNMLLAQWRKS